MTKPLHKTWLSGRLRQYMLSLLFTLLTLLAYGQKSKECGTSCFSTQIISLEETEDGCFIYELEVSYQGDCKNALSNYSLEMGCGVFSNASNSEGWPMELNKTNPTSGLTGLKVDGITEFGDESPLESFTVSFTFCPTDCEEGKSCFDPLVAYKAGQCLYTEEVDAQCILPLKVFTTSADLSCANADDGSLALEISGGEAPYQVNWDHGVSGLELNALSVGTYSYTVTSADGQSVAGEVVINSPKALVIDAVINQHSCGTASGGSISLTTSGGTGNYDYSWQDGSTSSERTGLAPGVYNVTVTDASGCAVNESYEILDQTSLELLVDVDQPGCGASSGSISLSVSAGQSPYTYLWEDGSTKSERTNLNPGGYSVVVTDAAGCETQASFEITEASQLTLAPAITHPTCSLSNGAIEIVVEGGTAPYTYAWKHGASGSALTDLAAGYYMVTVTDANGCQKVASYSLVAQTNLYLAAKATNTNCQDDPIGAVDLTIYGGTAPFTYQWDNGATTEDISELTEGTYTVTVTDAIGCSATLTQEVKRNTFFVLSKVNHKLCNTRGSIDLTVYYATEPIQYEWSNGETTQDLSNLSPGTYNVTITDGTGCRVDKSYTVYDSNNLGLSFNASATGCGDQITYELEGVVAGGTAPFEYLWSNGATSSTLTNVQPGTYELTISDANGCTRTSSYTIEAQSGTANCLIQSDVATLECGSSGNIMTTDVLDAQSYQWSVSSTDGLWTIDQGANSGQISFTAGGENSTATFSLELVTASGCVASCSYDVSSCIAASSDNSTPNDGTSGDGTSGDGTSGDGSTNDGSTGDGSSGDGSTNDGSTGDGSSGNGSGDSTSGDDSTGDGTSGDGTSGDGSTNDGSTGDASSGDGSGDGTSGDGSTGDGSSGDGSTDDGSTGDGTSGDGSGDGMSGDGSTGDGTSGDGSGDGTSGDGSTGDGTSGNGTSGDGSTNDGSTGDGTSGDGTNTGNEGSCVDCFFASVVDAEVIGETHNYSIKISTDLSCNFDLSNLVIAVPECATLETYSNSMNWQMEKVTDDKNTGLTGIKVEGIPAFGKDANFTEFTVNLTLKTADDQCQQMLACWSPEVAFKAGQCVTSEFAQQGCATQQLELKAYPNPASSQIKLNADTYPAGEVYELKMYDTHGNVIRKYADLTVEDLEALSISIDTINTTFVYLKVTGSNGNHWSTKVMISQ